MVNVFISYRREDSNWAADRLLRELEGVLGRAFFYDVTSIQPGKDFRTEILQAVTLCRVMIVVIGQNWLEARSKDGNQRIDCADDWVRFEIETALSRGIDLIPVLLHPATLPLPSELPSTLADLSYRQAIVIYPGQDFNLGFQRLVDAVKQYLSSEELQKFPRSVTDKQARQSTLSLIRGRHWLSKVLWLVCMILIASLVLSVVLMPGSRELSTRDDRRVAAELYSSRTYQWFDEKRTIIETVLLSNPTFETNDRDQLEKALREISTRNAFPGGVYALDSEGVVRAQFTPNHPEIGDIRGSKFAHRDYFIESRRQNRTIITNSFSSANRNEMIVVVASPRLDRAGQFIGIIDGVIDIATSTLSDIAETIHESEVNGRIDLFLLDDNGIVIASNKLQETAKAFSNVGMFNRLRQDLASASDTAKAEYRRVRNTPYHVLAMSH